MNSEQHTDRDASLLVNMRLLNNKVYRSPWMTWNKDQAHVEHKLAIWADICEQQINSATK